MLLKISGVILIIASTFIASNFIKTKYINELKAYEVLSQMFMDVVNTLAYAPVGINDLLNEYRLERYFPYNEIISSTLEKVKTENTSFNKALESVVVSKKNMLPLKCADLLLAFGCALDENDIDLITGRLKTLIKKNEININNARSDLSTQVEVYSKLVKLCGILLVVIFI